MFSAIADGLNYLTSQSGASLLALFWFTAIFEVPRYSMAFVAATIFGRSKPQYKTDGTFSPTVSVIVAGYNEADAIERCVMSLREQSRPPDEIVVISDGSRDAMPARLRDLQARGLIDQAHCTDLRAGKSAGVNLGKRFATGDVIINVDCDCSYDRHALQRVVEPLQDPSVGAVSGNILSRNAGASLVATFQAIEYLVSISLGKQASALTDHIVCVSGAFGAFRKDAMAEVGGLDVGGGEDLDITLRLRKAGWGIRFAPDAICYTDVPADLTTLIKQRFRWERDAVRVRYRKHGDLMNPFSERFSLKELAHEIEFFLFNVVSAVVLPFYVLWLFLTYGDMAPLILLAAQAGLLVLDSLSFVLAALATPKARTWSLFPFVLGFGLFNGFLMRFVRLAAYLQEWLFNASSKDSYVPEKVQILRKW